MSLSPRLTWCSQAWSSRLGKRFTAIRVHHCRAAGVKHGYARTHLTRFSFRMRVKMCAIGMLSSFFSTSSSSSFSSASSAAGNVAKPRALGVTRLRDTVGRKTYPPLPSSCPCSRHRFDEIGKKGKSAPTKIKKNTNRQTLRCHYVTTVSSSWTGV